VEHHHLSHFTEPKLDYFYSVTLLANIGMREFIKIQGSSRSNNLMERSNLYTHFTNTYTEIYNVEYHHLSHFTERNLDYFYSVTLLAFIGMREFIKIQGSSRNNNLME
jgi:hypothetical protein